jgi:RNA polymerase sigma-70 factor (ECF subfamily)
MAVSRKTSERSGKLASIRRLPVEAASDADLARAAAKGAAAAQGQAFDRFAPLVRGLLRRSLGPQHDVDDQLQEVFIRFFRNVATLRDPEKVRSFLIGITIRVAASELRRRRMRRWLRLSPTGELPEGTSDAVDDDAREALRRLYGVLDTMGDQARLAFVLRHIEGLELTDVADGLGVSLATAKRRLAKVRKQFFAMAERDPVLAAYAADRSEA